MPYYKWRGVDLTAAYCSGKLFARDKKELEDLLLQQQIALVQIQKLRIKIVFPIQNVQIKEFFRQIATLLHAGILLPQALEIVGDQIAHARMQSIVRDITRRVVHGHTFSNALAQHDRYFSLVMIHMVRVGEESGCIARAIDALTAYLETSHQFKSKIRSAAMMPCITLVSFVVMVIGVVVSIVPRFAQLFSSMGKELPPITQTLLTVSEAMQSMWLWAVIGTVLGSLFFLYTIFYKSIKPYKDRVALRIPVVCDLVQYSTLLYWYNALEMLLASGVQLAPALHIAYPLIQNNVLQKALQSVVYDVEKGRTLYFALLRVNMQPVSPDILALMHIGQESGTLESMMHKATEIYRIKVDRVLSFCTTIIQPLLLAVIGLLVSFLVFALYMPIFNLAQVG